MLQAYIRFASLPDDRNALRSLQHCVWWAYDILVWLDDPSLYFKFLSSHHEALWKGKLLDADWPSLITKEGISAERVALLVLAKHTFKLTLYVNHDRPLGLVQLDMANFPESSWMSARKTGMNASRSCSQRVTWSI
jgi:hypothetical protein